MTTTTWEVAEAKTVGVCLILIVYLFLGSFEQERKFYLFIHTLLYHYHRHNFKFMPGSLENN